MQTLATFQEAVVLSGDIQAKTDAELAFRIAGRISEGNGRRWPFGPIGAGRGGARPGAERLGNVCPAVPVYG